MQVSGREPSMEEILASIKKVIAEDKEARVGEPRSADPIVAGPDWDNVNDDEDDVLELNEELAPAADLGPPLIDEAVAGASRSALAQLSTVAASVPAAPPPANPLEEMIREMLRPILKQWLDDHLPRLVDEHVKREISRITGRPL
jgi:cell pole-organizing protein PopZ